MGQIEVNSFLSFNLSIILLFVGKASLDRVAFLRRYSIPEPVIGGFLCAAIVALVYGLSGRQVVFDLSIRDWLLVYFFAAIGLKSELRSLIAGGRPLLLLTLLAAAYIVLQNLLGMLVAAGFGMDPKVGLMAGSISLVGVWARPWPGRPPSWTSSALPTPSRSAWPATPWV
nr:sodium/glutamate symporter [Synechococcus sp. RSCCF101]